MQSIGERLEEARKKKGVSIREAAEATKIRGDFLDSFENDNYDIGVPDIYVRGFLNNYARFLKIDPNKVVTDYNSFKLGGSKLSKRDRGDTFGRFDLPENGEETAPESERDLTQLPFGNGSASGKTKPPVPAGTISDSEEDDVEIDYTLYWKAGLAIAVVVVVFLLIIWIINLVINQDDTPDIAENLGTTTNVTQTVSGNDAASQNLIITATDRLQISIRTAEAVGWTTLVNRQLAADESFTFEKTGPIVILFSKLESVSYELNGKRYIPQGEGPGRITLP